MSELKVYIKPLKKSIMGNTIVGQAYYLKSEADKVLADKDKEIAELKAQKAQAEDDCAFWKNLAQKNATDNEVKAKQRTEAIKHYMELADKLKEKKR